MNNLNHTCYTLSRNSNRCDVCGARLPRLIDADALKEAFEEVYPLATNEMGSAVNKRIYDIVDNAPTVFTQEDIDNVLELSYISGQQHPERPKGKWEYTDGRWGLGDWRCSKCGGYSNKDTHYCPNCGADMRGDV